MQLQRRLRLAWRCEGEAEEGFDVVGAVHEEDVVGGAGVEGPVGFGEEGLKEGGWGEDEGFETDVEVEAAFVEGVMLIQIGLGDVAVHNALVLPFGFA